MNVIGEFFVTINNAFQQLNIITQSSFFDITGIQIRLGEPCVEVWNHIRKLR